MRLPWRRKEPEMVKPQRIQKKQGCKFRSRAKKDGVEIEFSPECTSEDKEAIMSHVRGENKFLEED